MQKYLSVATLAFFCTYLPAYANTFALSVNPESASIPQGRMAGVSVNITGTSIKPVALSAAKDIPKGVSVRFNPQSCKAPCSSVMTVAPAESTIPGKYSLPILSTADGMTSSSNFTLTVSVAPKSDYSLTLTSDRGTVSAGESISITINLDQESGKNENITVKTSGLPSVFTAKLSSTSCRPPCNLIATISVPLGRIGTYPMTISAANPSIKKSTNFTLTVIPPRATTNSVNSASSPTTGNTNIYKTTSGLQAPTAPAKTSTQSKTNQSISQTLSLGSKGSDVVILQNYLSSDPALYPGGTVSGYYGALTAAAVGRFQIKYGIVGSSAEEGYGSVGPRTLAKINSLL